MKTSMKVLLAGLLLSGSIMAQEPPPPRAPKTPEERAADMSKRMSRELALTPDQQTKVKEIILSHEKKRDEKMKDRKEEMDKADAEFKTVLTPEQYQKFQQKREEMKKKREEKRGKDPDGMAPEPPPPGQ